MRVLVVDTALALCSAGVFEVDGGVVRALGLRSEAMARGHQERLGGMVRDAVDMALAILKGEKVDPVKIIPTTIVDRDNYEKFLDPNSPY